MAYSIFGNTKQILVVLISHPTWYIVLCIEPGKGFLRRIPNRK